MTATSDLPAGVVGVHAMGVDRIPRASRTVDGAAARGAALFIRIEDAVNGRVRLAIHAAALVAPQHARLGVNGSPAANGPRI
jgi:hypothetical protein